MKDRDKIEEMSALIQKAIDDVKFVSPEQKRANEVAASLQAIAGLIRSQQIAGVRFNWDGGDECDITYRMPGTIRFMVADLRFENELEPES